MNGKACVYICTKVIDAYKINLLIAKSKVVPIKGQSLPRLELCAAILLSRTCQKVIPKQHCNGYKCIPRHLTAL